MHLLIVDARVVLSSAVGASSGGSRVFSTQVWWPRSLVPCPERQVREFSLLRYLLCSRPGISRFPRSSAFLWWELVFRELNPSLGCSLLMLVLALPLCFDGRVCYELLTAALGLQGFVHPLGLSCVASPTPNIQTLGGHQRERRFYPSLRSALKAVPAPRIPLLGAVPGGLQLFPPPGQSRTESSSALALRPWTHGYLHLSHFTHGL